MEIYVFKSAKDRTMYGLTQQSDASNLPSESGPWTLFKRIELQPGGPARIGLDEAALNRDLAAHGFHVTRAKIRIKAA